jgi:hypothetical protein
MSFGCSIGDLIAVGTFAWQIYSSCKGAPESFENISSEVFSLHAVLEQARDSVLSQPLSPPQQKRLKVIRDGCYRVLEDLEKLVKKYQGLGTQRKRTLDRMKWSIEDVAEIRARLSVHIILLTAFMQWCVYPFLTVELSESVQQ